MDKKIDQIDIDEATVKYYKSGKKVKKIQSTHFDNDVVRIGGSYTVA